MLNNYVMVNDRIPISKSMHFLVELGFINIDVKKGFSHKIYLIYEINNKFKNIHLTTE